jgi:c-di-GMP-related signal transduction protein
MMADKDIPLQTDANTVSLTRLPVFDEQLFSNPDIAPSIDRLKTDGFMIAITGFSGSLDREPIYRIADIISVSVEGQGKDQLSAVMSNARHYDAKMLATRVADPAMFALCRQMGFSFFSGSFFKKPDEIKLSKITSNEVSRFNLLHLLGLFSLLDVMLGVAMTEIVTHLPLDAKLKSALCSDPNSEYLQLLDLCRVFEEADWREADQLIQRLNLDGGKVRIAFQRSVDWAVELTQSHVDG